MPRGVGRATKVVSSSGVSGFHLIYSSQEPHTPHRFAATGSEKSRSLVRYHDASETKAKSNRQPPSGE